MKRLVSVYPEYFVLYISFFRIRKRESFDYFVYFFLGMTKYLSSPLLGFCHIRPGILIQRLTSEKGHSVSKVHLRHKPILIIRMNLWLHTISL